MPPFLADFLLDRQSGVRCGLRVITLISYRVGRGLKAITRDLVDHALFSKVVTEDWRVAAAYRTLGQPNGSQWFEPSDHVEVAEIDSAGVIIRKGKPARPRI